MNISKGTLYVHHSTLFINIELLVNAHHLFCCSDMLNLSFITPGTATAIIIIMVIFKCYFSGELIALS